MSYIEMLVVDDHEKLVGRKAILCEDHASLFVEIVRTSHSAATVKHGDGQLQKCPWGKLLVESIEQ